MPIVLIVLTGKSGAPAYGIHDTNFLSFYRYCVDEYKKISETSSRDV